MVPTLGPPSLSENKAGQQDRQDRAYTIPYNIASKERIIADTNRTPKLAKGGFRGPPRGGGRTPAPKQCNNPSPCPQRQLRDRKCISTDNLGHTMKQTKKSPRDWRMFWRILRRMFFWSGGFCGRFYAAHFSNGIHNLNVSPQKFHRKIPLFCGTILQACRGQVGTQTGNGPIPSSTLVCSLY